MAKRASRRRLTGAKNKQFRRALPSPEPLALMAATIPADAPSRTTEPAAPSSGALPKAPSAPAPANVDRGAPIPTNYGRDQIVAGVRDPNSIFVYWDRQGPRREEVRREFGPDIFDGARWVLRIHSGVSEGPQDVPIMPEACNWYLHVPEDRQYVVEIGIVARDGRFICMSRSNPVRTPRKEPSDDGNCEWMLVEGEFDRVVRLGNGKPPIQLGEFSRRFTLPVGSSGFLVREHLSGSTRVAGAAPQKGQDPSGT